MPELWFITSWSQFPLQLAFIVSQHGSRIWNVKLWNINTLYTTFEHSKNSNYNISGVLELHVKEIPDVQVKANVFEEIISSVEVSFV